MGKQIILSKKRRRQRFYNFDKLDQKKKAIFRMVSEILRKQSDPNLGLFLVRYKNVQKFWREKLFFQKSTFQLIEH
jgi:hypothetical protein